ncbi:thioredoxin domain-containing protein [Salibacterium halotolerans]|uniref:Thioredoxin n=1 Tax=Salibacterium halotolerans TaxID=1884432 RepID=A0A1I5L672_9BACI|nr:thioredoxin domain-containing protein [Salibacterium halotolerans]SFO92708.1 Thioredoxin [Salibacterium halotolerans]
MPGHTQRLLAAVICLMLPLTACAAQSQPAAIQELHAETSVLLFSDDNNLQAERPFYRALLTKSNNCSADKMDIKVISSKDEDMAQYFGVSSYPSLYVMKGAEQSGKYEGAMNKTDIETFLNGHVVCEQMKEQKGV